MRLTSQSNRYASVDGYSLMEILIVLAIMSLTAAIAIPRAAGALDQVISHAVFFDFQRQVLELRSKAFREERGIEIVGEGRAPADAVASERFSTVLLRAGWKYELGGPLTIDSGGKCSSTQVDLTNRGRRVMHLESRGSDCRFLRTL